MKFYELIRKMECQVNNHVHHYQDDFYEFDIPFLAQHAHETKPVEFHWFFRETGTHLSYSADSSYEFLNETYRNANEHEFILKYTPKNYIEWSYSGNWEMEKVS